MQVQTLTISTEKQTTSDNVNFKVTTFEMTTTGFCDICGKQETSTKENLKSNGWFLGEREHFCPNCNY